MLTDPELLNRLFAEGIRTWDDLRFSKLIPGTGKKKMNHNEPGDA